MKLKKIFNYILDMGFGQPAFAFAMIAVAALGISNSGNTPYFLPQFDLSSFIFGGAVVGSGMLVMSLGNVFSDLIRRRGW